MLPGLIIRSSSIHAAGCYTMRAIKNGTRICEYDGPRLTKEAADDLYQDRIVTYLFGYGDKEMVIDGFGTGMFVNHSCAPNCETIDEDGHIFVDAIRDIAAGEELLYEYNLYDSGRRHSGLLLRRKELPRHHVLRPRIEAPQETCEGESSR